VKSKLKDLTENWARWGLYGEWWSYRLRHEELLDVLLFASDLDSTAEILPHVADYGPSACCANLYLA
jgi:hypothetical protein